MKKLSYIGRCITESLTASTSALVCALISVPLTVNGGSLESLMPAILFFACMKTGNYLLHSSVHVLNPYKLIKYCIVTALVGSIFLLCADPLSPLYVIGSVISGIGLSVFSSNYKFICDKEENPYGNVFLRKIISSLLLVALGFLFIHSRNSGNTYVLHFWWVYLAVICVYIFFMPGREKFSSAKTVELKEKWILHSIPAVFLFFIMAAVSGYKQLGSGLLYFLMFMSLILLIASMAVFDDRRIFRYSAVTLWLGATRGFMLLFALIYIANMTGGSSSLPIYIVILISGLLSGFTDSLFSKLSDNKTVLLCMCFSLIGLALMISRNEILMLVGVFVCVVFTDTAKGYNLTSYRCDNRVLSDEYRLRQDKMYSLGNGLMQAVTMIVFYIVGKLVTGHGTAFMQSYIYNLELEKSRLILFVSGIICILFQALIMLIIVKSPAEEK